MNWLERKFLKSILKDAIVQGPHTKNIIEIYTMIREAVDNEFTEDNHITKDDYLREMFEKTQFKDEYKRPKEIKKIRRRYK